jgi:hypothetical protein
MSLIRERQAMNRRGGCWLATMASGPARAQGDSPGPGLAAVLGRVSPEPEERWSRLTAWRSTWPLTLYGARAKRFTSPAPSLSCVWCWPAIAAGGLTHRAVLDAEDVLNVMIERLGHSEPVSAQGMAMTERIITSAASSPLYNESEPGALRGMVLLAIAALDAGAGDPSLAA